MGLWGDSVGRANRVKVQHPKLNLDTHLSTCSASLTLAGARWPHILLSSVIVDKHHVANEQREGLLKVSLFI